MNESSPFKIRADLLKQAQDIVMTPYYRDLSKAENIFIHYIGKGEISQAEHVVFPLVPTTQQILDAALELNKFVCTTR